MHWQWNSKLSKSYWSKRFSLAKFLARRGSWENQKISLSADPNYILSINFNLIEGYLGQGSTNQTELQREWFRNMLFPFPPLEEQEKIVDTIKKTNIEIDRIIFKATAEIGKAKEYQESLITQIVTGQLKVPVIANANLRQNIELGVVAESNEAFHSTI